MESTGYARRPLFTGAALRQLIIPLILEQFLAMSVGLAAVVMITKVGESAVSGVSLVDSLNNLIISILTALCTGGAVVCAQYLGRGEPQNARSAARQLLYIALIFAAVVGGILLAAPRFFISLIFGSVDEAVRASARTYLIFTSFSIPFLAVYSACAALFRAMGNSRVSLLVSVVMNVINIGSNLLLIYALHFGVVGAGISTLAARAVAAVFMLALIRNPQNPIFLRGLHRIRFERNMVRSILSIGLPNGFENGLFNFGKLLVQALVATLGTAAIAANAIIGSISNIVIVPGSAFSLAIITVIGQCVGAGDYAETERYLKKLMLFTYLAMACVSVPLLLFYRPIVSLFHLSAEAVSISAQVLPVLAIGCITFWPLSFAFPNALRAAGDARYTMFVSASTMWIVRYGLSLVFVNVFGLGVAGVWYGMFSDWIVRSALFLLRYRSGVWKTKRVLR